MELLSNILLAVLPAMVVFFTSFYLIKTFIKSEQKKQYYEFKTETAKTTIPLRLQAYERIALYLERIAPGNLVMRIYKPGMSARLMQSELLKTIRSEYDHNVAQQVYLSSAGWQVVKKAKEETIRIVNIAITRVGDDANGNELGQAIIEIAAQLEKSPSDFAMEYLKIEIKNIF